MVVGVSGTGDEIELESRGPGRGDRRRRLLLLAGPAVAVSVAFGVLLWVADDPPPDADIAEEAASFGASAEGRDRIPVTAEQKTTTSVQTLDPTRAVQAIEVHTGLGGGEDIVFVFDGPLPDAQVTYAPDINDVHAPGIAYTIQRSSTRMVCESAHFDPGLPATGTITVLIPSEWWRPGAPVHEVPYERVPPPDPDGEHPGSPGKIVGCGPYDGCIQYAIWAPASDELADVSVRVSDDSTRVVVEVRPAKG